MEYRAAEPPNPEVAKASDVSKVDFIESSAVSAEGLSFSIVGVGASAGGLEAFTQFLEALPVDTGMAFVLVQHLAPTHASILTSILSRSTELPVTEVQDESAVEPNHIYVIPPGQNMVVAKGVLKLTPRPVHGPHRPIDEFFSSLAADQGERAIGIVLSGTARDGTAGLKAIKAEGGITFAQDSTAQQDGMPSSAIASGCVDFVLPPHGIAVELARISKHPFSTPNLVSGGENFSQVLKHLHREKGIDFGQYKSSTLNRRVARRLVLQKIERMDDYLTFLRQNPAETEALYQEILIGVTSFFRNPEAFAVLKTKIFPRLVLHRAPSDPLRFWTVGCSTGQEAYSLAMAFAEFVAEFGSRVPVQIFATDLNAACIEKARAAVYSKDIANEVSPDRLRRFFVESNGGYRIAKSIRDQCVFSRHNLLSDPPFSRMDLISCRNLLIYLQPPLQKQVIPLFHYALNPHGVLWLGSSETIGTQRELFEVEDSKHKIYSKKAESKGAIQSFPLQAGRKGQIGDRSLAPQSHRETTGDLQKEADRIALTRYAPPGVLVSADLEILQIRGDTTPFLTPSAGKPSLNLLKMLREGLLVGVSGAVLQASKDQIVVKKSGLRVKLESEYRELSIEVIPVGNASAKEKGFLILFEEIPRAGDERSEFKPAAGAEEPANKREKEEELTRVTQELAATREYLQAVIEQQEAANEELQSVNEESQSSNEELQSINEELETSKEEIQSSNEELATVNDELNNRNVELNRLNDDLVNLLGSVETAIVMLGADLCVRRFTSSSGKLLNIVPADIGRPIRSIRLNFDLIDLESILKSVLESGTPQEREIQISQGGWYVLRIRPYKTLENKIDGVVMMFVDVETLHRRALELTAADRSKNEFLAMLAHELRNPLAPLSSAAQLLKHSAADPAVIEHARLAIERQLYNMTRLIDDLLDASRLTQNKVQLRKRPLELGAVLRQVVESQKPRISEREQQCTISIPPEPIYLEADPTRLEQIFGNLLHNASKYSRLGGRIELVLERSDSGADKPCDAVVYVRDNGIGIGADQLNRIFDLFVQIDVSLERSQSGLGIGLTLVKKLVELHGGSIEVHSPGPDQGSEFVVRLPALLKPPTAEDLREPAPAETALPARLRILVVDDNIDSATLLSMELKFSGHDTCVAFDGEKAIETAAQYHPDVILLDIGLPKLNGYEAARKIREQPWGKNMVLVALTGWGQDEDREKSKAAGFDHHLVKPVNHDDLMKVLSAVEVRH